MSNLEESEDSLKQILCKEEIIDKGYDPATFVQYMISEKEGGDNIDKWSMSELVFVIKTFQQNNPIIDNDNNINNNNNQQQITQQEQAPKMGSSLVIGEQQQIQLNSDLIINSQNKYVECKKQKLWIETQMKVTVIDPAEVSEGFLGFFGATDIKFLVQILPMKWKVRRAIQDFFLLRQILEKQYPEKLIPPLSSELKMQDLRTKDKASLRGICQQLEIFLGEVILKEEFLENQYLQLFLQETNQSRFTSKLDEAAKMQKCMSIKDKTSKEGILNVSIDKELFTQNLIYIEFIDNGCHKEIYDIIQSISIKFEEVQTLINKLAKNLNNMSNQYDKDPIENVKIIYTTFASYMISWGSLIKEQNKNMQDTLGQYFKWTKLHSTSLVEIKENLSKSLSTFYDKHKSLINKKKELFKIKDISKWEIKDKSQNNEVTILNDSVQAFKYMCTSDNIIEAQFKDNYCYFSQSFFEEMQKFTKILYQSTEENLLQFGTLQMATQYEVGYLIIQTQIQNVWKHMTNEYASSIR